MVHHGNANVHGNSSDFRRHLRKFGSRRSEYKAAIVKLPPWLKELEPTHHEEVDTCSAMKVRRLTDVDSSDQTSSCKTGTDGTIKTLLSHLVLLQICTTI